MQKNAWVKKIYFQMFELKVLQDTYKIHCIGQSETTGLASIFTNNKSYLLPYGFESQNPALQLSNDLDKFIIGFVGRLDIYTKGLDLLIKAFSAFTKEVPQTELWILGDSDERSILESMITVKRLSDKIILFGSKFGQENDQIMAKTHKKNPAEAGLLVDRTGLPSRSFGTGFSPLVGPFQNDKAP